MEKHAVKEIKKLYSQVSLNPTETAELARAAIRHAESMGYFELSVEAYLLEAYSVNALSNSIEALRLANKAYTIASESSSNQGMARVLNMMSIIYFHSHQYDRGIRTIVHAIELIDEIDDSQLIAAIYNNLAEIYFSSKDYYYALQYYEHALNQALINPEIITVKAIEMNIAITYMRLGNRHDAKMFFQSALSRGTRDDDPLTHAEIEYRLAMIRLLEGDTETADALLRDSETILHHVHNSLYLVNYYYHRALCDIRLTELESIHYLNQALVYAQALEAKQKICDITLALSECHEQADNVPLALTLYKQYHQLEKELESTHLITKLEILKEELDQSKEEPMAFKFQDTLIKEIELERTRGHRLLAANQELKKIALHDELTGIPNRRSINDRLSIYLNTNESIALFLIDIDHFKRYNDAFGHLQGDACLVEISKILNQHAEFHSDFVGRYGGEEFLYVGRVDSFDEAQTRAENLRRLVEAHQVMYSVDDREHQITICIGGIYVKNSMAHHKEFLLNASDQQLYKAKEEGRNQTRLLNIC
jgi:diguanylate cyclase (GGDEF)-like protein